MASIHINNRINKNVMIVCSSLFISTVTVLCSYSLFKKRINLLRKLRHTATFLFHAPLSVLCRSRKIVLPEIDKNVEVNLSDNEIEEQFVRACSVVRLYRKKMKLEQWLFLYGLYKQSIDVGDRRNNINGGDERNRSELDNMEMETDSLDFVSVANEDRKVVKEKNHFLEKQKNNAVKHCQGLNERQCKFLYIKYFNNLFPNVLDCVNNSNHTMIGTTKCISKIKDNGGDNTMIEKSLCDTLCYNVVSEDTETVKDMLRKCPYLINEKNAEGLTALHYACDRGYIDIAKMLVENGASVNVEDPCGDTPLHMAAYSEQMEVIDYLLTVGANINKKNEDGLTMQDILNKKEN